MITFFAKIFVNRHDKISFDIFMEIIKREKIKSSRIKNEVIEETLEKPEHLIAANSVLNEQTGRGKRGRI